MPGPLSRTSRMAVPDSMAARTPMRPPCWAPNASSALSMRLPTIVTRSSPGKASAGRSLASSSASSTPRSRHTATLTAAPGERGRQGGALDRFRDRSADGGVVDPEQPSRLVVGQQQGTVAVDDDDALADRVQDRVVVLVQRRELLRVQPARLAAH